VTKKAKTKPKNHKKPADQKLALKIDTKTISV